MHRFKTWQLFAGCVLIWGTTWFAITFQVGDVVPVVAVALRFAIAGTVVLALTRVRGQPWRFSWIDHARFAFQGAFMYGISYVCVYEAERHVVSGLVAVGYSASPLVTGLGARALFRIRVTRRFVLGGVLGLLGVVLIFWPEFRRAAGGGDTAPGALFTVAAVLLSAVGSLAASRNRLNRLPFWPALGFGMLYGAALSALLAVAQGAPFAVPLHTSWWLSLTYLALAGSVLTFACFLTLQERIGPGPTAAVGVMTPLLALVVSMIFEGFRPDMLTFAGAALAVTGNVLLVKRG
jgi:drug/metabolite transporter (DMT)-like permease